VSGILDTKITRTNGCRIFKAFIAVSSFLALASCGGHDNSSPTQVAARVNTSEITIHQVNNALEKLGVPSSESDGGAAARKTLDALIDQELLVQQALVNKLDRDPKVMQAIEDAKRQILTEAFLDRKVYVKTTPTPDEVKNFYKERPDLFSNRKKYRFTNFQFGKDQFTEALQKELDSARTSGAVGELLGKHKIDFSRETLEWAAEQVPMELLPQIAKLRSGDIASLLRGNGVVLMQLEEAVPEPVDESQAGPAIEAYLSKSKNRQLAEDKVASLRSTAAIQYVGNFAEGANQSKAQPEPVKDQPAEEAGKAYLQKGLSGLKK
jgi:EpsD family peptidyl-prolyl cis-trans isomerase